MWGAILGLQLLGAIAIPATNQLVAHDFEFRFQSAGVSAILCTCDWDTAHQVDLAAASCPELKVKIAVGGSREGWHDYDGESVLFTRKYDRPEDAPWVYSCVGKFGNVAKRRVNTIFDKDIAPWSNMVLGEVLNDRGNWSGYLPHRHPQPECYYFKFDRPEGFGASFVGDQVFKSVDNSFSAIPGGCLHPQAVAPGFQMYTCWMIRHLDGNPWLQTTRNEDERYLWLHDAQE